MGEGRRQPKAQTIEPTFFWTDLNRRSLWCTDTSKYHLCWSQVLLAALAMPASAWPGLALVTAVWLSCGGGQGTSPSGENQLQIGRQQKKGRIRGRKHPPTHHRQMVGDGQFILLVSKSGLACPRAQKKAVVRIWFGNNTQGVKFL